MYQCIMTRGFQASIPKIRAKTYRQLSKFSSGHTIVIIVHDVRRYLFPDNEMVWQSWADASKLNSIVSFYELLWTWQYISNLDLYWQNQHRTKGRNTFGQVYVRLVYLHPKTSFCKPISQSFSKQAIINKRQQMLYSCANGYLKHVEWTLVVTKFAPNCAVHRESSSTVNFIKRACLDQKDKLTGLSPPKLRNVVQCSGVETEHPRNSAPRTWASWVAPKWSSGQ